MNAAAAQSLRGGSGRIHSQAPTTAMQAIGKATIHPRCEPSHSIAASRIAALTSIVHVAAHLARRETARC